MHPEKVPHPPQDTTSGEPQIFFKGLFEGLSND